MPLYNLSTYKMPRLDKIRRHADSVLACNKINIRFPLELGVLIN